MTSAEALSGKKTEQTQMPKQLNGMGAGQRERAQAQAGLFKEFSAILDKIAVQVTDLQDKEFSTEISQGKAPEVKEVPQPKAELPEGKCVAKPDSEKKSDKEALEKEPAKHADEGKKCDKSKDKAAAPEVQEEAPVDEAQVETETETEVAEESVEQDQELEAVQPTEVEEVVVDGETQLPAEDCVAMAVPLQNAINEAGETAKEEVPAEELPAEELLEEGVTSDATTGEALTSELTNEASEVVTPEEQAVIETAVANMPVNETAGDAAPVTHENSKGDNVSAEFMRLIKERLEGEEQQQEQEEPTGQLTLQDFVTTEAVKTASDKTVQQDSFIGAGLLHKLQDLNILKPDLAPPSSAQNNNSQNTIQGVSAAQNKGEAGGRETDLARQAKNLPRAIAARTLSKVEDALKEVAKSRDGKTISVRLDPPSLGKVQIDLSMRDGNLHARLVAESPAVNQLLRDKSSDMQMILRKLGLNADQVTVSVGFAKTDADARGNGSQRGRRGNEQREFALDESSEVFGPGFAPAADAKKVSVDDHWVA